MGIPFEQMIGELKRLVPFKETTDVGDLVLVAAEADNFLTYAMVTGIERDRSRRDEWYHLQMVLLTVPPQPVTWTLRPPQFTGQEIFTMGGDPRFLKAVDLGQWRGGSGPDGTDSAPGATEGGLRLV